jgi:predicted NUDIX family NTP pyrophosphohydrolase
MIAVPYLAKWAPVGIAFAVLLSVTAQSSQAQQFMGNARQKCAGVVTVKTSGATLTVRQFEARSAELSDPKVSWQCENQPQVDIQCPANTNRVLIDRSQGGTIFSIVCLHQ